MVGLSAMFLLLMIQGEGTVSILSMLFVTVLLIPNISLFLKQKLNFSINRWVKALLIIILIPVALTYAPSENTVALKNVDRSALSAEDSIKVNIQEELGLKNNMGKERVKSVKISDYTDKEKTDVGYNKEEKSKSVLIELNSSENLTSNLQKATLHKEAVETFKAVFSTDGNIKDAVVWAYLPLRDQYGNVSDDLAVSYAISRELFEKVNWSNFYSDDLPALLRGEALKDDRNMYVQKVSI
jgi:hypothetical protein